MRGKYHADCWGNLHDHNGKIGVGDISGVNEAVIILNRLEKRLRSMPDLVDFQLLATPDDFDYGWVKNTFKARIEESMKNLKRANSTPQNHSHKPEFVWVAACYMNVLRIYESALNALCEEEERRKRNEL